MALKAAAEYLLEKQLMLELFDAKYRLKHLIELVFGENRLRRQINLLLLLISTGGLFGLLLSSQQEFELSHP